MKTHYDPFSNSNDLESYSEKGYCGTYVIDGNSTNDKDMVDCKKCKKLFERAGEEMKFHSEQFAKDCQGLVDFVEQNPYKK